MNKKTEEKKTSGTVEQLPAIIELAETYNLTPGSFVHTFKSVAMPKEAFKTEDFIACCLVAREHGLNPLTKEIYFMKTKGGSIQPIVSVDGWIKKMNEHPQFDGIEFSETTDEKTGKPVSMTCTIWRKDRKHPTAITEYYAECMPGGGPVWKSHPHRMMRNRTLCQCARVAFGFAGIMEPDEFRQWEGPKDITPEKQALEELDEIDVAEDPVDEIEDVEVVTDDDDSLGDESGFLAMIEGEINGGRDPAEIYDAFSEMAERLSESGRGRFDSLLDGAQ